MIPWKDALDSILKILELIKGSKEKKINDKKAYFLNHIQPAYKSLEAVRKDYVKSLTELLKMGLSEIEATIEMVVWLQERKNEYENERSLLKKIRVEFDNSRQLNDWKKKNDDVVVASEDFLESVVNFFEASNDLQQMSWYSYLIDKVEQAVYRQKQHPELQKPIGILTGGTNANIWGVVLGSINIINIRFDNISGSYFLNLRDYVHNE